MTTSSEDLCRRLIDTTESAEAPLWLHSEKASLGVMSHSDSLFFIEKAYRIGAKAVIAVEITAYPAGSLNTGRICVEMPDDPESRARVLSWAASVAEEQGFDGENDDGQQFVFLMLD